MNCFRLQIWAPISSIRDKAKLTIVINEKLETLIVSYSSELKEIGINNFS